MKKKMLSLFLMLTMLLSTLSLFASADTPATSGAIGETLVWSVTQNSDTVASGNGYTLSISGTGEIPAYAGREGSGTAADPYTYGKDRPWYPFIEGITRLEIGEGITAIGKQAFYMMKALASVELPNSMVTLGHTCFAYDTELKNIELPENAVKYDYGVFLGSGLTEIVIPEGATSIPHAMFENCKNLRNATIPYTVKNILDADDSVSNSHDSFKNCKNLTIHCVKGSYADEYARKNNFATSYYTPTNTVIAEGDTGDVKWKLELNDDGRSYTLVIFGEGRMDAWDWANKGQRPWRSYSANITALRVEKGVKNVGAMACMELSALREVQIADTVTRIEGNAFNKCIGLTSIYLPDSVRQIELSAFAHCTSLSYVHVPLGLYRFDESLFKDCTSLNYIYVPETLIYTDGDCFPTNTTIIAHAGTRGEEMAKYYSHGLLTVKEHGACGAAKWYVCTNTNGSTVLYIEGTSAMTDFTSAEARPWHKYAADIEKVIAVGIKNIGDYAFKDFVRLEEITLMSGLEDIGKSAFDGCAALKELALPEGVTVVGAKAFAGCTSLESVRFPSTLTALTAGNEFDGSNALKAVYFTGSTTFHAEKNIFANAKSLTIYCAKDSTAYTYAQKHGIALNVVVASGQLDNGVMWTIRVEGSDTVLTYSGNGPISDFGSWDAVPYYDYRDMITKAVVEEGITYVGRYTFGEMPNLKTATVAEGVTALGQQAFCYDDSLETVKLPDSITSIGYAVFKRDYALKNINIPKSLTTLEKDLVFEECKALETLVFPAGVSKIYKGGGGIFKDCPNLTVYCEKGSIMESYVKEMNVAYAYTPNVKTSIGVSGKVNAGDEFKVTVKLSAAQDNVDVAGIRLTYDTAVLEFVSCSNRTDGTLVTKSTEAGNMLFELSVENIAALVNNNVLEITFRAKDDAKNNTMVSSISYGILTEGEKSVASGGNLAYTLVNIKQTGTAQDTQKPTEGEKPADTSADTAPESAPTVPEDGENTTQSGGCGSSVSLGTVVCVLIMALFIIKIKKGENKNEA